MSEQRFAPPESLDEIARRLRFLRSRITANQSEFARLHDIAVNTWNNYEQGVSRIRVDEAKKMSKAYGVSLDFIYMGITALLPAQIYSEWESLNQELGEA